MIALGRADSVAVVDVASRQVRGYVGVGQRPWQLAITPDGTRAVVAAGNSNSISVIDIAKMAEISRIPAGNGAWGVALGQ